MTLTLPSHWASTNRVYSAEQNACPERVSWQVVNGQLATRFLVPSALSFSINSILAWRF